MCGGVADAAPVVPHFLRHAVFTEGENEHQRDVLCEQCERVGCGGTHPRLVRFGCPTPKEPQTDSKHKQIRDTQRKAPCAARTSFASRHSWQLFHSLVDAFCPDRYGTGRCDHALWVYLWASHAARLGKTRCLPRCVFGFVDFTSVKSRFAIVSCVSTSSFVLCA